MTSENCKLLIRSINNCFTDKSKEDSEISCAVISDNHRYTMGIHESAFSFTAEANEVYLALYFIRICDNINNCMF